MTETSQTETRVRKAQPRKAEKTEPKKPVYLPLIGVPAPQFLVDIVQAVRRPIMRDRERFINEMPDWFVKQSLKIVGAIYIASEMMMLKAAGITFIYPERKGNWRNYITDPVTNTFKSVISRSFGRGDAALDKGYSWSDFTKDFKASIKGLFSKEQWKQSVDGILDLDKAAEAELKWQKDHGVAKQNLKLVNRWQARATLFGFSMMALGFMLPDKRQTKEEAEEMAKKADEQPIAYAAERLKQAVDVTEYPKHKRQYVGLGLLLAGACSFVSGFRTPGVHTAETISKAASNLLRSSKTPLVIGKPTFVINKAHSVGGLITMVGGSQLMLAAEDETGWSRYGATMMTRIATVYKSIKGRFETGNQDKHWYVGATAGFQTLSFLSFMLGGASKEKAATKAGNAEKPPLPEARDTINVKDSSHLASGVPVYAIEHRGMLETAARQETRNQTDGHAVY